MKRLEVNPNNEKYYTKEFISGFRCGTKRQLESDLTMLEDWVNLDDYDSGTDSPLSLEVTAWQPLPKPYKPESEDKE